jgi:hypothetical protein
MTLYDDPNSKENTTNFQEFRKFADSVGVDVNDLADSTFPRDRQP